MKHSKWSVLISAIFMQLVLGVIYIWGVFQPEVAAHYGWSISVAAMVFSVMVAFIVVGSIIGGKLQDTFSPRPVVMISGVLIGIGTCGAAFTPPGNPFFMYVTYGVLTGSGIGAIYTTTIAVVQKWFKEKKAVATGIVLGALGFGGVVFTPVAQYFLTNSGVPQTFIILGVVFFIICVIGGLFMVNPYVRGESHGELPGYTTKQMLKSPMYYVIVCTLALSLPAFFMISPLIKILCAQKGLAPYLATYVVMASAVLNSCGRFVAPVIASKVGDKNTVGILNIVTIGASIGLIFTSGWAWVILVCMVAVCFGGFLGIFPGITSEIFGTKNAASNYGFVLIGYGVSAIFAPGLYEFALNFASFAPFVIVAASSAIAVIVSRFILKRD